MNPFSRGAATRSYDQRRTASSVMLIPKRAFFVVRKTVLMPDPISLGVAAPRLVDLLARVPGADAPGYCISPLRGWEALSVSIVLATNAEAPLASAARPPPSWFPVATPKTRNFKTCASGL